MASSLPYPRITLSNPWPSQAGFTVHEASWLLKTPNNIKNPLWWRSSTQPKSSCIPRGPNSHLCAASPLSQLGSPCKLPHWCLLSHSPHSGNLRQGGLSVEQLFISLCRGNLGLFMEIQTLLNTRCFSEKENFFCFGEREGWRGLFFKAVWKTAECLLWNIEELH